MFFPNGEVSIKEKILDEGDRILSVNGLLKSRVLKGVCTTVYNDNAMNIKYRYKVRLVSAGFCFMYIYYVELTMFH